MKTTMRAPSGAGTDNPRSYVSGSHKVHQERLRRRAGAAIARIPSSGNALAEAIGRTHVTIVHRKAGKGHFANALLEIYQLERGGHDTTSLLEALIETQLEARGLVEVDLIECAERETEADGEEDRAQTAFLTKRGSAEAWKAKLIRYVAEAQITIRALGGIT